MDDTMLERHLENLDRRLARVEQILPTLATRDELQSAVAVLATKEELRSAVAPLATKDEVRAEGERSRRHMTVLIEHQNSKIELLAEHLASVMPRPREG